METSTTSATTGTRLIGPGELELDAVVPQCLDNQFISDQIYSRLASTKGRGYRDKDICAMRERAFRKEFVRSVVYSSQVIIQRAFLKNSEFLYKNYRPDEAANLSAFASLLRERAIVPYLFRESSLQDNLEFDTQLEGDRATKALLSEVGEDVTCVRLSPRDSDNATATASMATDFGGRLSRLAFMNPAQRNAMASELFADPGALQAGGAWEAFNSAVTDLALYAVRRGAELGQLEGRALTRQDVYLDRFVVAGTRRGSGSDDRVRYGQLRPRQDDPYAFELKKYVDLVYNVNLPDNLNRFTFTPLGMPTRMALQDSPGAGYEHEVVAGLVSDEDALEAVRRAFQAHAQKAMSLPLLDQLTIADVAEIRQLDEWAAFKDAQTRILREPLRVLEHIDSFQSDFDRFQAALSDWYNARYQSVRTEERYCSYVTLALSLAGKLFVAGSQLSPYEKVGATLAADQAAAHLPQKVKGYAAKLMVGVYDLGRKRLDADRSYTVELMQTSEELLREDVLDLLQAVNRRRGEPLPNVSGQLADQGVK